MTFPQIKRRFSLFGSQPPRTPTVHSPALPQNLNNITPSHDIRKDNKPVPNKSIENLEKLVLAADEYRDCLNKLSKFSKDFSKCLKDYGNGKEIDKSNAQCLQFTAQFYENYAEILAKLNKALRKEFDTLQKFWGKYSKKVAKDEKDYEDYVGDLDKQIKKITKDYEKKSKKENKVAESHDKYMASLTSINSDITRARTEHAEEVMKREKHTHSVISQIVCRLVEGQFASFNESLKKCGPCITKIKERAPFAGQSLPPILDLDSFLDMQNMTLPPENNHDNGNNEELIYSGNKPSHKPSKKKGARSISSILEIQKAAMKSKSRENVAPLIEEPEDIDTSKEGLLPDCKSQFTISVETTTTTTTTVIADPDETLTSSIPPIVTATTEINPPISSTNVPNSKEKPSSTKNTPNLLSSLSIGIHDNDNPFFRDYNNIGMTTKTREKTSLMTKETKFTETTTNCNEKENSIKNEDNHIVSLTPPPIYNKSRDIIKNNNNRTSDQLKNTEEINISSPVPIGNTFRISFIENNENGGRKSLNECKEDHQAMDCTGTIKDSDVHVCTRVSESPTPSFDTETLVRSFPIDLPSRSIPQTPSNSPKDGSGRYDPIIDIHHSDSSRYSKNSGSFHSSLPDNKRRMSVADIRERLLSLNTNERRLSTQSVRDFPKPRQGYVNEVKSKFGETSNLRSNNDTIVISKSRGDVNNHRDDMYPEHSEEINSNKSTINEQCNCHNCQEIRRAMTIDDINHNHHPKDSFLPEDDLTFGRINY